MKDLKPHNKDAPAVAHGIPVAVLYRAQGRGVIRDVVLPEGATVMQAIDASGLMRDFPELHAELPGGNLALSSHGRRLRIDLPVLAGQRIEILHPLQMSPKDARRQLAAQRNMQRGKPRNNQDP